MTLHLMKSLINTDETTLPMVIQTINNYNSKIGYLQFEVFISEPGEENN